MPSFAISIALLGLVQGALVALPAVGPKLVLPAGLRSRWWALLPAMSIIVVIAIVALDSATATALAYLALLAVPPLAAAALGWLLRGSRPAWATAAIPFFALAWASPGSLAGQGAALALSALACVSLGRLLVAVVPEAWLKLGIYAMAAIDTWLIVSDLLQGPNATLSAASPGSLPQLQVVHFGSAQMGFGDLFVAATVGCLYAGSGRRQLGLAALVAVLALFFDLLFFAVDELPATVPVAVALALSELSRRRSRRRTPSAPRQPRPAGPPA